MSPFFFFNLQCSIFINLFSYNLCPLVLVSFLCFKFAVYSLVIYNLIGCYKSNFELKIYDQCLVCSYSTLTGLFVFLIIYCLGGSASHINTVVLWVHGSMDYIYIQFILGMFDSKPELTCGPPMKGTREVIYVNKKQGIIQPDSGINSYVNNDSNVENLVLPKKDDDPRALPTPVPMRGPKILHSALDRPFDIIKAGINPQMSKTLPPFRAEPLENRVSAPHHNQRATNTIRPSSPNSKGFLTVFTTGQGASGPELSQQLNPIDRPNSPSNYPHVVGDGIIQPHEFMRGSFMSERIDSKGTIVMLSPTRLPHFNKPDFYTSLPL